jgi:GH25 family lysozyme M1 (1,4-beta-N-acetylmuramidase)
MNRSNGRLFAAMAVLCACGGTELSIDEETGNDTVVSSEEQPLVACSNGAMVSGIDVSHWNGSINWSSVKASGRQFAYIAIGDGTWVDPLFTTNWQNAKAAGVYRGVYQYFRASGDPTAQANVIINRVGKLAPGDLPVMLDIEELDGMSAATTIARMRTWLTAVQKGTGKVPIIYTNGSTFDFQLGSPRGFAGYPLFVANWGVSCPNIPNSWKTWKAWQWSATGRVSGIWGDVDLDVFNGGMAQLRSWAGVGPNCVFGDGNYCGGNGVVGDPRTLFKCTGGVATVQRVCANGCVNRPAGEDDSCAATTFCPAGDGLYCGTDLIGGDPNTLYRCTGGTVTVDRACANGCRFAAFGSDDFCN